MEKVRCVVQNVSLQFASGAGQLAILREVSVELGKAERVSITGPSGSGKTSFMMVLAGIERPSAGAVLFHTDTGEVLPLHQMGEDALAEFRRYQLGIVFQSFHLIPTMTAAENVALPLQFANQRNAQAKAQEWLNEVGLADRATHYPTQLSGGEQQRVALARALVAEPPLILADEPTGNLDQNTGADIMRLLLDLPKKYGASLVLITHDLALAKQCDRQLQMQDGRLQ